MFSSSLIYLYNTLNSDTWQIVHNWIFHHRAFNFVNLCFLYSTFQSFNLRIKILYFLLTKSLIFAWIVLVSRLVKMIENSPARDCVFNARSMAKQIHLDESQPSDSPGYSTFVSLFGNVGHVNSFRSQNSGSRDVVFSCFCDSMPWEQQQCKILLV